jgi:hypothetical protein
MIEISFLGDYTRRQDQDESHDNNADGDVFDDTK